MKRNLLSKISIFLSFINILIVLNINHDIALRYQTADGKTKALFGVTELLCFGYRYYFLILSLVSIIIISFSLRKKENRLIIGIASGLTILSIILITTRIWRLMV